VLFKNRARCVALTKGHLGAWAPLGPGERFVEIPPTGHEQNQPNSLQVLRSFSRTGVSLLAAMPVHPSGPAGAGAGSGSRETTCSEE
jgi:hypothetical protein